MKKLSLRILCALMAMLLIVGLTACGGNGDTESSTPTLGGSESGEPQGPGGSGDSNTGGEEATTTTNPDGNGTTKKPDGSKVTTTKKPDGSKVTTTKKPTGTTTTKAYVTTTKPSRPKTSLAWKDVKKNIPSSARGKTIEAVDWNEVSNVPGLNAVNSKFARETGIKITYTVIPYNDYFSKITARINADDAPDTIRIQNPNRPNLVNLQPLDNTGYDFYDTYWDQSTLDAYTFNGKLYGVNVTGSPIYCPNLMFYNTKLIENYMLDDPYTLWKKGEWTWDALFDICEEYLKQAGDGAIGVSFMAREEIASSYGLPTTDFNRATGKYTHNMDNPLYIKAWQLYAEMYSKTGMISTSLTNNDAFDEGKLLFNSVVGMAVRKGHIYFNKLRETGVVGVVPMPGVKGQSKTYNYLAEAQAFGLAKGSKNAELVPYYLRYMFDPANYDMKNYYGVKNAEEVINAFRASNPLAFYSLWSDELGMNNAQYTDKVRFAGKKNVPSIIDQYQPMIEAAIKDANVFMTTL